MVIIEAEEKEETEFENLPSPEPNPRTQPTPSSASETTTDSSHDTASPAAKVNGSDSDGFETASEREVSDNEEEEEEEDKPSNTDESKDQELQQRDERGIGTSSRVTQNDAELNQRDIEQANEAKLEGNRLFGNGQYEEALVQYDFVLQVAPLESIELRSICHSNRGVCFLKLGKYEDTVKECTKALELNPSYMKALVRRGEAHEKLEHFEEAIADMKKILELDPSHNQAKKAIHCLEPLAAEKQEKMKEEMIGKLKEMGNSLLGRFGMSVDNFKAVKDPNTGSYSISFQR